MKQKFDPHQMTLSQFLLFLVIGGFAVICLFFTIAPRLRYGDPLYPVDNYVHLRSELISNKEILLPEESVLPSGDHVSFYSYESTRKKLDPVRDGYQIGVLSESLAFSVECSPADAPIHLDGVPDDIRPDYICHGIPVMVSDAGYPQLEFIVEGYYYNVSAWGRALPDNAMDTLYKITDNILEQAG